MESHIKFYNKKHWSKSYNIENKVFFNSKNIESTRPLKKLDYKFYRPYKIENQVVKQAYHLKLLSSTKIHNIFHPSLLKLCQNILKDVQSSLIKVNSEEHYKVKKILDSRTHYGKL